jgi:hypothetical protein
MRAVPTSPTSRGAAEGHPGATRDPSSFDGFRQPESLGRFLHRREPIFLDGGRAAPGAQQAALYSMALFDLDAGPVTVTLPRPGRREMTLTAMDERHALLAVHSGPGPHALNRDGLGASRVMAVFCLMLDLTQPDELARARALQDAIKIRPQVRPPSSRHWTTCQPPLAL